VRHLHESIRTRKFKQIATSKAMREGKGDEEATNRWLCIEFGSRGDFLWRSAELWSPSNYEREDNHDSDS
jgi:hypothetical protein